MRLTTAQLEQIRTLNTDREPGEWNWEEYSYAGMNGWETKYYLRPGGLMSCHWQDADTAFVAACSWAVPLLIAEVEALREENERLKAQYADPRSDSTTDKANTRTGPANGVSLTTLCQRLAQYQAETAQADLPRWISMEEIDFLLAEVARLSAALHTALAEVECPFCGCVYPTRCGDPCPESGQWMPEY